jgi:predicted RNA-binding Zn-ribbon protein involved in translation (DUF1610 family)
MVDLQTTNQKEAEMALKFKCRECGEHIITKFLKVGEVAKCRNCGAENVVPENALRTDEEPKDIIPTGTKPEMVEKTKGNVRPVESVIGLSIITLSVYLWVYLFKTLREMKNTFTFDAQETNPDRLRPVLIVWLVVTIVIFITGLVSGFITGIAGEAIGYPSQLFGYARGTIEFYVFEGIFTIVSTALFVAFWYSFVKLIETCQKKGGMVSLNRTTFWILIAINAVVDFAYIGVTSGTYLALITVVSLVVSLILLYLTVKQVNRLWTESRGVAGP